MFSAKTAQRILSVMVVLSLLVLFTNSLFAASSDDAEAYYGRGFAYLGKDQFDMAMKDINKAISLKPDLADAYNARGLTYVMKGQSDMAIDDINKVISLKPDYADAYSVRGYAYAKKGQNNRALADYKKSCELGNNVGCKQVKVLEGKR